MQAVTSRFTNTAESDSNKPVSKVQLVLGNYFSSAAYGSTIAGDTADASGDYPLSGIIDGDRTEINIGPASTADNDIGKSSYKSSATPSGGSPVTFSITLSQSRTLNRIKVYHRSTNYISSYALQYWNGSSYVTFAATVDRGAGAWVSFTSTHTLDVIDFDDISSTIWRMVIYGMQGTKAEVVEMEGYRLVDISDKVKTVSVSRQRDYKLANPMAAQVTLECINTDRYFSINHVSTASEITADFINDELQPEIGIVVQQGFDYYGAEPEYVTTFIGTVDRIITMPKTRDAIIEGRDGMKAIINKTDSCKLKTGQSIDANIRYVLNRTNISNYEMSLDISSINIDYFFTEEQDPLDTCRDLTQASVDALFYFDELGIVTFRSYAGSSGTSGIPNQKIWTSAIDWASGISTNLDLVTTPTDLLVDYTRDTGDGDFISTGNGWTRVRTGSGSWNFLSTFGSVQPTSFPSGTNEAWLFKAKSRNGGRFEIRGNVGNRQNSEVYKTWFHFMFNNYGGSVGSVNFYQGYSVRIENITGSSNVKLTMCRNDSATIGTDVELATFTGTDTVGGDNLNSGQYDIKIIRTPITGRIRVYGALSGTLYIDVTDTTYTTGLYSGVHRTLPNVASNVPSTQQVLANICSAPSSSLFGTWQSPILDTGSNTTAFGLITDTNVLNSGLISYQTQSSTDGVVWDSYVAVSGTGLIQSTVKRYLRILVTLNTQTLVGNPDILDITVNWTSGGGGSSTGTPKYPSSSSFTFSFDSTLLDVQQELADNLGGDSAILNDVIARAQPLVLTGTNADTVWQGTIGTPPTSISVTTPRSVVKDTVITIAPIISGGMDTSLMSGVNSSAAVVVFAGGATGSWVFSTIHPTRPVLTITITNSGLITDLRIIGKTFSNASYLQAQQVKDAGSIAKFGDRQISISNSWIVSTSVAATIAQTIVDNFLDAVSYIPTCAVRPTWNAQLGDRVTIQDTNLDLNADYIIVGISHKMSVMSMQAEAQTDMVLLKVPSGS